ncbi:MAG: hypothetical protein U1F53_10125 [Burkholderiaceae bacterium]
MSASMSLSLIRHRLSEAHAGLRAGAFVLATVVTLGCVALLARMADREYFDATVVQAEDHLAAAYHYVTGPRLP